MKHIQKRLNSKTDETSDELDGNYKTLKENLPGEESIINNSDPDQETDLEYFNPVFKPRPTYNTNLGVTDDYDKLAFQNSTSKLDENSASNKNNEEIEMLGGVSNYGYIDEKKRPESWDQDLSAVNHYSTAIRNPVNIPPRRVPSVGMEMSESPPRDYTNSISKQSDYSSISEGNPYLVPGDKGPQYEDLAAMREQHKQQQQTGIITSSGSKKANMIYESAVITQKSEKYRKRTSIDEATGYDENSNYCHLICTILIGILAIVALLVIFLMVFGVINAKCKDCDESATGPTTAAQAQQKDFSLQLQYLQGNLTQLKNEMTSNSSDVVKQLENELAEQKLLVESLTRSLNSQIAITSLLNNTASNITNNWPIILQGEVGIDGPKGPNGTTGIQGENGIGISYSKCKHVSARTAVNVTTDHASATASATKSVQSGMITMGVFCSSKNALKKSYREVTNTLICICNGVTESSEDIECVLNMFYCSVS